MLCLPDFEAPTDFDGFGVDSYGEVSGYWYLPATDSGEGTWIGIYGDTGFWRYDEDSEQTGTWWNSDNSSSGTFMKDSDNEGVFIDTSGYHHAQEGEECGYSDYV